jgi:hypothetical protein
MCVSKGILSPLTAKVQCLHYRRQITLMSEAVEAVAPSQDGLGGAVVITGGN